MDGNSHKKQYFDDFLNKKLIKKQIFMKKQVFFIKNRHS
jgi:hypothetical protein